MSEQEYTQTAVSSTWDAKTGDCEIEELANRMIVAT